jgi:hypothetical protein
MGDFYMFNKTLFIALTLLISGQVHAASVTILNPSFEDDGMAVGVLPDNWDAYNAGNGGFGTYPPEAKTPAVDDFYNNTGSVDVPPEGDYVEYTYIGDNFGMGHVGLQQTLTATLMANSQYDLSAAVGNLQTATSPRTGNFLNFDGFPGYEIQLLAGETLLASDFTSADPGEGQFEIASLSFTSDNSHLSLIGQALGIRLINQNMDIFGCAESSTSNDSICEIWNSEVDFDNVALSVSAVPVPAAVWLFGTALIGLVGFGKRRKAA